MSITHNVRQARGVTVVDLSGRITLNDTIAPEAVWRFMSLFATS